jgi:hypothetical protein
MASMCATPCSSAAAVRLNREQRGRLAIEIATRR